MSVNQANTASYPQQSTKNVIYDTDSTSLRLEIIDLIKQKIDNSLLTSTDFLDFEKEMIIKGALESLVNLKSRVEADSSRQVSKIILHILEQNYYILASKNNKYLKLRDLSWNQVFGIMPEIRVVLKNKQNLLHDLELFISQVQDKCSHPYQYYWLLLDKSKDPRAILTPEENFLLNYLQSYDKAMNKNSKVTKSFYESQQNSDKKFSIRKMIKSWL
jgi:hypothetical protein